MPFFSGPSFERRFRSISAETRRAFLADLWAARGYDSDVQNGMVLVNRETTVRIGIVGRWPWQRRRTDADVDKVVGTGDRERMRAYAKRHDAEFVPPAEVLDLLLYGIDREVAEKIAQKHLGVPLRVLTQDNSTATDATVRPAVSTLAILSILVIAVSVSPVATNAGISLFDSGSVIEDNGDGTPESTTESRSATSEGIDAYPRGLSAGGVTDSEALFFTHHTQLGDRSYVTNVTFEGPPNALFTDRTVRYESTKRVDEQQNKEHTEYRMIQSEEGNETIEEYVSIYDVDDRRGYQLYATNGSAVIRNETGRSMYRTPSPARSLPYIIFQGSLSVDDTNVTTVRRSDETRYRVTATADSTTFERETQGRGSIQAPLEIETGTFEATAEFTTSGRLLRLSAEYADRDTGEQASLQVTYSRVGEVDRIRSPPWLETT